MLTFGDFDVLLSIKIKIKAKTGHNKIPVVGHDL